MTEKQEQEQQQTEVAEGSLLEQIMQETRLRPSDEGYTVARRGVEAFITEMLAPGREGQKIEQRLVDQMIGEIDAKLGCQLDEILHNEQFRKLEAIWRGLKFLIDGTDFRENLKIEVLSLTKDELLEDFEDAPEVTKSGLYKHIYAAEFGQFGGKPYGVIIGGYEFSPGAQDIKLLQYMASVGAMSHAPFIGAAAPDFFGLDSYDGLPNLKDLEAIFEGPQYTKWRGFREADDARNIGLVLPQFMLRNPYGKDNPIREFNYEEAVTGKNGILWGNATFALASRLAESFALYRWCPNIIGPQSGGAVTDLPVYTFEDRGEMVTFGPTDVTISDRREYELAEQGFIPLTVRKGSDNAVFFSADSVQKPKYFGTSPEARQAETNFRLGTQLPYMFVVDRLAHYIKVLQRENIGSWKTKSDLNRELNEWIGQYVADQDNPPADVRSRRPLRSAQVSVCDVEGNPGWYKVDIHVQPHFKYMGAAFTLSLSGRLDKEAGG